MRAAILLALAGASAAQAAPAAAPAAAPVLPASNSAGVACDAQAARYESGKGFAFHVIRAGMVRIDNPLRPLTPDFTQVLEVVIGHKRATAYGPDFTSLRRGGPPNALAGVLGGAIQWDPTLPILPDNLGVVGDDGRLIAALAFKACEPAPEAAPEPPPKVASDAGKKAAKGANAKAAKGAYAKAREAKGESPGASAPATTQPGGEEAGAKPSSAPAKKAQTSKAQTSKAQTSKAQTSKAQTSKAQDTKAQAKKTPDKTPSGFTMPSGALPE